MALQLFVEAQLVFKNAIQQGNQELANAKLLQLKALMLDLESLPPHGQESVNGIAERTAARDFLEYAVVFSVQTGDKDSFPRYLSSLRPYYTSHSAGLPQSDLMYTILGLNLLYLLVENKLVEFHSELEFLTEGQELHPAIAFCTQLDQHLMVGSYDQVMAAAANPPVELFAFFLRSLLETVRINIAECAAAAYITLTVQAATEILMFTSAQETLTFVAEYYPGWSVHGDAISLKTTVKAPKSEGIHSLALIEQSLSYATEIERIV